MNRLTIILLFFCANVVAFGQDTIRHQVNDAEKAELIKLLGLRQESFTCQFTEEKRIAVLDETVVSKGIIVYEAPDELTCEYTEPESLVLTQGSKGDLTVKKNGKPIRASMMHRQMMEMMKAFISGKAVGKSNDYSVEVWSGEIDYKVILTPTSPSRFSAIELYLDKKDKRIAKTVLKEKRGDTTTITMTEQRVSN